jgi:hypothetical protein
MLGNCRVEWACPQGRFYFCTPPRSQLSPAAPPDKGAAAVAHWPQPIMRLSCYRVDTHSVQTANRILQKSTRVVDGARLR